MKLGLRIYAVSMPIESSCMKFINNMINSFKRCEISQNYRILHKVVQHLFQHNLEILNYSRIQNLLQKIMFPIKLVGTAMIFHCKRKISFVV
jgi:hypothetical protein